MAALTICNRRAFLKVSILGGAATVLLAACDSVPTPTALKEFVAGPALPALTPVPITAPTVVPSPTPPLPTPTSPPPTPTPYALYVGNTGGDGVYIRRAVKPEQKVKAWPDGTEMVLIGADQNVDGRTWKNVRDPDGNVGWVPAEYLVAVEVRRVKPPIISAAPLASPSSQVVSSTPLATPAAKTSTERLYPVSKGGRWGYMNSRGVLVIEPAEYARGFSFSDGLTKIVVNGKLGYMDSTGRIAIQPTFGQACEFSEGLAAVSVEPLTMEYDPLSPVGLKFKGRFGFVDKTGRYVIEPQFTFVESGFRNGMAPARVGDAWGYVDKSGHFAISPRFNWADQSCEGLAVVQIDTKYGFIDRSGRLAVEARFDEAERFSEGLAPVKIGGKAGFVNNRGAFAIEPQFDFAWGFSGGLARVGLGRGTPLEGTRIQLAKQVKFGYVDRSGSLVINPKFDQAGDFSEGLAAVSIGEGQGAKWRYINTKGGYAFDMEFSLANDFKGDLASVSVGKRSGYVDRAGKWVWQGD